jgi:hypothetical protein
VLQNRLVVSLNLHATPLIGELHLPTPTSTHLYQNRGQKETTILELIFVSVPTKVHGTTGTTLPFQWDMGPGAQPHVAVVITTHKLASMIFRQSDDPLDEQSSVTRPALSNLGSVRHVAPKKHFCRYIPVRNCFGPTVASFVVVRHCGKIRKSKGCKTKKGFERTTHLSVNADRIQPDKGSHHQKAIVQQIIRRKSLFCDPKGAGTLLDIDNHSIFKAADGLDTIGVAKKYPLSRPIMFRNIYDFPKTSVD